MFRVDRDRAAFLEALRARNVLMVEYPHGQVRAVTHHGIDAADIETTLAAVAAVLRETAPADRRDALTIGRRTGRPGGPP